MKKTIYTLNVDGYAPEITALTYPLLRYYANKIGADFHIINKRKFPDFPVTYEKLQIFELAKQAKNDWNMYIDSDALIHPDTPDWTVFLNKDTVAHNGKDFASYRWRYNEYFLRDGRNIGSCNWFTIASDWCLDLWHPLDIPLEEALQNIYPTVNELNTVVTTDHLIDDYTLSRNIARYGFKFKTLIELQKEKGVADAAFHWHLYTITNHEKVNGYEVEEEGKKIHKPGMKEVLDIWGIPKCIREYAK